MNEQQKQYGQRNTQERETEKNAYPHRQDSRIVCPARNHHCSRHQLRSQHGKHKIANLQHRRPRHHRDQRNSIGRSASRIRGDNKLPHQFAHSRGLLPQRRQRRGRHPTAAPRPHHHRERIQKTARRKGDTSASAGAAEVEQQDIPFEPRNEHKDKRNGA